MQPCDVQHLRHRLLVVTGFLGQLLTVFGLVLGLPALVGLVYAEYRAALIFALSGAVIATAGWALWRWMPRGRLGMREAILLCTGAWSLCAVLAAVPLATTSHLRLLDAIFECVSGLTTTGLTVFADLDAQPHAVLFWRSTSQLLGGLGILSFFLLVSYPGSAAHRLLQTESTSIRVPRPTPSLRRTVIITWLIYGILLVANVVILLILDVRLFDALNFSFATTSTGGFSPYSLGVGAFRAMGHPHALAIELVTAFFMLLGGVNYLLHYQAIAGHARVLFTGTEARRYWLLLLGALALIMTESLLLPGTWEHLGHPDAFGSMNGAVGLEVFRTGGFQAAALISSTGHFTLPLAHPLFGPASRQLFLFLLLLGGCAGSTAGGVKIVRATVLGKSLIQEIRKLSHPEGAVLPVVLDGKTVETRAVQSMAAMAFAWIVLGGVGGVLLALDTNYGGLECLSLSVSALSNVGPSLLSPDLVPGFPAFAKVLLMVWMIAGRLEILPVLALLSHRTWRQ